MIKLLSPARRDVASFQGWKINSNNSIFYERWIYMTLVENLFDVFMKSEEKLETILFGNFQNYPRKNAICRKKIWHNWNVVTFFHERNDKVWYSSVPALSYAGLHCRILIFKLGDGSKTFVKNGWKSVRCREGGEWGTFCVGSVARDGNGLDGSIWARLSLMRSEAFSKTLFPTRVK